MTNTLVLDEESAEWIRELQPGGAAREDAVARLHAVLLRTARGEALRRRATVPARALDELDHLCVEAASDALLAILAMLESSSRLRRLAWRNRKVETDESIWDRLPDAAPPALQAIEQRQLLVALRHAIGEQLTERQRFIFQS